MPTDRRHDFRLATIFIHGILLPHFSCAFSTGGTNKVYATSYGSTIELDQAAWESPQFWRTLDAALPGWSEDPALERFRGFCGNLRSGEPGVFSELPTTGQEVLEQYVFPGLDQVQRAPFPAPVYPELEKLVESLTREVGPVAREEFAGLLANRPLVSDHHDGSRSSSSAGDGDDDTWNRAAWYVGSK